MLVTFPAPGPKTGPKKGPKTAKEWRTKCIILYIKNRPEALPTCRKRALTPSPEGSQLSKRLRPNNEHNHTVPQATQSVCPLLDRLPAELRLKIWELAVGGQDLHIDRKRKKMGHRVCEREHKRCRDCDINRVPLQLYALSSRRLSDQSLLPLSLTCRRIYSETLDVLYTKNTFHFTNVWNFAFFRQTVLRKRFTSIRSLFIHFRFESDQLSHENPSRAPVRRSFPSWPTPEMNWKATCRGILAITDLRRLRIRVIMRSGRYAPAAEPVRTTLVPVFEGLKGLELKEFTVGVPKGPHYFAVAPEVLEDELKEHGHRCTVVAERVRRF